jgi:hypothetical protein
MFCSFGCFTTGTRWCYRYFESVQICFYVPMSLDHFCEVMGGRLVILLFADRFHSLCHLPTLLSTRSHFTSLYGTLFLLFLLSSFVAAPFARVSASYFLVSLRVLCASGTEFSIRSGLPLTFSAFFPRSMSVYCCFWASQGSFGCLYIWWPIYLFSVFSIYSTDFTIAAVPLGCLCIFYLVCILRF